MIFRSASVCADMAKSNVLIQSIRRMSMSTIFRKGSKAETVHVEDVSRDSDVVFSGLDHEHIHSAEYERVSQ